ncbi:response regulator transcription factor [Croceicoccus sp. Ery5]|uniref:response regulator transcription factor n=1 Tax=Croceicoccus sp. Ery5 TaxID=1703340 RepID=UPI001E52D36E|nr:response regulator [Croceicoccus sp. Ery5]
MSASPLVAIVDDDEDIRHSLCALFVSNGYAVATYASADAFCARANAQEGGATPAMVITDLHMPGMTGLEMIRMLRGGGSELPFVLVTAFATPAIRSLARRYGVVDVVEKPFRPLRLLELVRETVG